MVWKRGNSSGGGEGAYSARHLLLSVNWVNITHSGVSVFTLWCQRNPVDPESRWQPSQSKYSPSNPRLSRWIINIVTIPVATRSSHRHKAARGAYEHVSRIKAESLPQNPPREGTSPLSKQMLTSTRNQCPSDSLTAQSAQSRCIVGSYSCLRTCSRNVSSFRFFHTSGV